MAPCAINKVESSDDGVQQEEVEPYLYAPPTGRDKGLNSGGVVSACKLLFLCLLPGNNRYG